MLQLLDAHFYLFITGSPNGPVLFCSLASVVVVCRRRLSASSVVVCNAAGRRARGRSAAAGPAAGRVDGRAADTARRTSTVTSR